VKRKENLFSSKVKIGNDAGLKNIIIFNAEQRKLYFMRVYLKIVAFFDSAVSVSGFGWANTKPAGMEALLLVASQTVHMYIRTSGQYYV
jgi:hypothetical protein